MKVTASARTVSKVFVARSYAEMVAHLEGVMREFAVHNPPFVTITIEPERAGPAQRQVDEFWSPL